LVEDAKGNKYVLKKGSNTSKEHVKSEYIANQLYNILGVRTPDYEMYEADDGEVYLLSRFISNAQTVGPKDYPELAKFFMADTMLANWDAYQNDDNCLRDAAGRIVHVDNGGALEYRARGDKRGKNFDGDILKSFIGMRNNNQSVYQCLDTDEVLAQIDDLKKKKDDVVNYLKESGEDHLADILAERFDNLDKVAKSIKATQSLYSKDVEERELLDEAEMYREFTDEELELLRSLKKSRSDVLLQFNAMVAEFAHKSDDERFRAVINGRSYDWWREHLITALEFFDRMRDKVLNMGD
jgi:hypothetical protein